MKFTAACIQTNCQDDLSANVDAVMPLVVRAAEQGAQFIALPENAFLMEEHGKKLYQAAVPPDAHAGIAACREVAREYDAWIMVGSIPVQDSTADGKVFNTAVLIDGNGNTVAEYRKIHLFDVDLDGEQSYRESNRMSAGEVARLVPMPWGKLGMSICYDLRFPYLYRTLAKAGATMFTVPAAFTKTTGEAHWHSLLRSRAIENGAYVIAPAQCGSHPGKRETYGHSLIIDPWGEVLADGGDDVGIVTAQIDTERVMEVRKRIPSLKHERHFVIE